MKAAYRVMFTTDYSDNDIYALTTINAAEAQQTVENYKRAGNDAWIEECEVDE